jgi:hypothetical protein
VPLTYSAHALGQLAERELPQEWVEWALAAPDWTEPDPTPDGRLRAFQIVPERGDRVLRVIYKPAADGAHVVSVFFDRAARRKVLRGERP